jgi:cytochrome c peroxidase
MERLLAIPEYRQLFQVAYPDVPLEGLGFQHAANALAAFQVEAFTLVNSPWDRYLAGDDEALSTQAKQGALLFYGPAGCAACHSGPLLSDQQFHNLGVPQYGPGRDDFAPLDYGRYHATGDPADRFAFRTPPLRNVTLTGPWLHNGAYGDLEDVVRHHLDPAGSLRAYNGRQLPPALQAAMQHSDVTLDNILASLDPRLQQPPTLSNREVRLLLAFLESLTDPTATELDALLPNQVPSGLPVGESDPAN